MSIKVLSYSAVVRFALVSGLALGAATMTSPSYGATPAFGNALEDAIAGSKIMANARLRYEAADQTGLANDADAVTYRLRAGFKTGALFETSLLVDFEYINDLRDDFNDTINGKVTYPVVADPDVTELNRFQLTNTGLPSTTIIAGRQRIKLDNDRFVGNVGWRQNEQTFDAARIQTSLLAPVTFDITYIDQVNRIFGERSRQGRFEGDSWLIHGNADLPVDFAKVNLSAFAYLLEFDNSAANSSETYGFLLTAKKGPIIFKGSWADQGDYKNQPLNYSLTYGHAELGYKLSGLSLFAGYEMLEGDGAIGFATPLATLHAFNGFADLFLNTPVNGLEDAYGKAVYVWKPKGAVDLVKLVAAYHDFSAERTSADYGREFDAALVVKQGRVAFTGKYADYQTDGFATDRDRVWVELTIDLNEK